MKRFILILLCVLHLTFLYTGCSIDLNNLSLKKETNTSPKEETLVYSTIITAIENEDFEMFKSVYSDYALKNAVDIEDGFKYICELYSGKFEEITHSNKGGGTKYINHSRGSIYNLSFGIRTDEKYYILRYSQWDFPEYKSMSGVHCVQLVESTKEETIHVGGQPFRFPGVYYPENEFLDVMYGRTIHFLKRMEDGEGFGYQEYNVNIRECMSDELLLTDDLDDKLMNFQNYFESFSSSDI